MTAGFKTAFNGLFEKENKGGKKRRRRRRNIFAFLLYSKRHFKRMSAPEPISVSRAKEWNDKVEEAYRFQTAGYRDETEYKFVKKTSHIERWPHNGYVKKLQRKDGNFYYYDKKRECSEKDVPKTKFYAY